LPIWSLDTYVEHWDPEFENDKSLLQLAEALGVKIEYFADSNQLWFVSSFAVRIVAVVASQYMPANWLFNS
jgi:hypothetical protein